MTCEIGYEELAALAAGDLPPDRSEQLRDHLAGCDACRRRLDAIEEVDTRLTRLRQHVPAAGAVLETRRLLSREVRGTGGQEVMTLEDVAEFLRVSVEDLSEAVPELPAFEIGGRIRVRRTKLIEWIEQRERAYARSRIESEVAGSLAGVI
jgi:hypothetical protein